MKRQTLRGRTYAPSNSTTRLLYRAALVGGWEHLPTVLQQELYQVLLVRFTGLARSVQRTRYSRLHTTSDLVTIGMEQATLGLRSFLWYCPACRAGYATPGEFRAHLVAVHKVSVREACRAAPLHSPEARVFYLARAYMVKALQREWAEMRRPSIFAYSNTGDDGAEIDTDAVVDAVTPETVDVGRLLVQAVNDSGAVEQYVAESVLAVQDYRSIIQCIEQRFRGKKKAGRRGKHLLDNLYDVAGITTLETVPLRSMTK